MRPFPLPRFKAVATDPAIEACRDAAIDLCVALHLNQAEIMEALRQPMREDIRAKLEQRRIHNDELLSKIGRASNAH